MKQFFYAFMVIFAFCACSDDKEEMSEGGIVGSVADKTTGEPVATVGVTLSPGGKSTVTGSDGTFSFTALEPGAYSVGIDKEGYTPNKASVNVKAGEQAAAHLLIERIPAIITADRKVLDFGADASINTLSFNIVNNNYEELAWQIEHNCKWIKKVNPAAGTLKYGATGTIVVVIDRNLLDGGDNKTVLVVKSSNGSSELEVRAVGVERSLPVLNTLAATNVTAMTATLNGEVTHLGEPAYTERGFVYNIESMPTLENSAGKVTVAVTDDRVYTCRLDGLTLGNTYYVRAYAKNSIGTAYSSNDIHFTTAAVPPVLSVQLPTDIDVSAGFAVLHATVKSVGEPAYTERGFVYATLSKPTVEDTKIVATGTGTGAYSATVPDLPLDETLYVRAYAVSQAGTVYSDSSVVLSTMAVLPRVTTGEPEDVDVSAGTATLRGMIISAGEPAYTERGFVYGTMPDPTVYDNKIVANGGGVVTSFSMYTEGLPKGKTYYVRAYATNRAGTAYGEVIAVSTEWVVLSAAGIAVQKTDIGCNDWHSVNTMCENSTLGGYTDWRLPTKEELMTLYTNRNEISGFRNSEYWSSSYSSSYSSYYYYVSFYNGVLREKYKDASYYARCVRSLK